MNLPWSDDEIIKSWLESGKTKRQIKILSQLNACGSGRIIQILLNAGLITDEKESQSTYKKWTDDEVKAMFIMRAENHNWNEIGDKLGRASHNCSQYYYKKKRQGYEI
ncbi:MAG TPA: hypothetical protein PKL77_08510 [Candidatus Omnitrophota bacterium]|nr:hypothetical protein [Candidatus Omnitrophota bacterium]